MDKALAFGGIVTLLALWIVFRDWKSDRRHILPPPKADERDSIQNFRRMHRP